MGEVSYARSAGAARSYNGAQRAPLPYMYCTLLFGASKLRVCKSFGAHSAACVYTAMKSSPLQSPRSAPASPATERANRHRRPETSSSSTSQQAGQLEVASLLSAAATARAESTRMEHDWNQLVQFRCSKLAKPGAKTAVEQIAKLLAERSFWQTSRLRAALEPLEKLFQRIEALHAKDLESLAASMSAQHQAEKNGLSEEISALQAQVKALNAAVAERDTRLTKLGVAYDAVQIAREVDVQRLRALLPEGYELVHTDDANFEAGLAQKLGAQSRAYRKAVEMERAEAKAEAKVWAAGLQSGRRLGDAQEPRGATTSCAQAEADATFAALKQHLETPKAIRVWRRGQSPRSAGEWSKVLGVPRNGLRRESADLNVA